MVEIPGAYTAGNILHMSRTRCLLPLAAFASLCLPLPAADPIELPDGLAITPLATRHSTLAPLAVSLPESPNFTLGQAVTTLVSPDGRQLLVLTSSYNLEVRGRRNGSSEYVFVYDVTGPQPVRLQALPGSAARSSRSHCRRRVSVLGRHQRRCEGLRFKPARS